jgi:UDP-N-acetylglucosamine--N-acetylmuramyl-(pentapeptide) pyrophosphoryl-undecaprenol N-acetylglucosamine transferase
MRVVLTGGGTGGHVYPALSVAEALRTRHGAELLYVGSTAGPEATLVPAAGIPFRGVRCGKLAGGGTALAAARALAATAAGGLEAVRLLRAFRPDVVLGTGGFASAAVTSAALLLRVPVVLHEANAVPGRVNAWLAPFCRRVAVTYPSTVAAFPAGRAVVTGMPVRAGLLHAGAEEARACYGLREDLPVLAVCGGSGGARSLNRAVVEALPLLEGQVQLVHQTGPALYGEVCAAVPERPPWYHPVPYVEDMPSLLAATDLLVCRAGSSTLAEVTARGVAALVVPYPHAVSDHQTANARALSEAGAAVLIPDGELCGRRLHDEVSRLLADPARLEALRQASRSLGRPEAAREVADLLGTVLRTPARPEHDARSGGAARNASSGTLT